MTMAFSVPLGFMRTVINAALAGLSIGRSGNGYWEGWFERDLTSMDETHRDLYPFCHYFWLMKASINKLMALAMHW